MGARLASELTSGYEEIDGQHRALLQRVEVVVAAAQSDDLARTRGALTALGDYLLSHFQAEESLMEESGYPERARHKTAHDLFMQDFAQLGKELGEAGLSPPVLTWIAIRLPEWLKFHVQVNDLPLGRYLTSRRFPPAAPARADKPRAS
jgi:hemerythrin